MEKIIRLVVFTVLLAAGIYLGRNWLAVHYCNQGSINYNRGAYKEAADSFKLSIAINPSVAMVHDNLAQAYRETNQPDKAIEEYRRAIRIDPKYARAYLGQIQTYWHEKKYDEALLLAKQTAEKFPNDRQLEQLIETISFEYMGDCLSQGVDLFMAGDKNKARELLTKALEIRPDFAYTHYTLGYFYFIDNDYKEAEEELNRALAADIRYWPAYKLLGDMYMLRGDYKEAVDKYSLALNLNPKNPNINNDLGLALMQLERYKEAAGYLKEALRLEPADIDIQYSLANVYKDMGLFAQAVDEYKKLISRKPGYPNIHNCLADSYKELGKKEEALEEYQKEIDFSGMRLLAEPDNPETLNNLAYAYNGLGNYKVAEENVRKALAIKPGYREAYLTLARIQENAGNNIEALASLSRAKSLSKQPGFIDRDISRIRSESLQALKNRSQILPLDIVYLKNGRRLSGVIKSENNDEIILEAREGDSLVTTTLSRGEIERIFKSSEAGR